MPVPLFYITDFIYTNFILPILSTISFKVSDFDIYMNCIYRCAEIVSVFLRSTNKPQNTSLWKDDIHLSSLLLYTAIRSTEYSHVADVLSMRRLDLSEGYTLHQAASAGLLDILELLIDSGAPLDQPNKDEEGQGKNMNSIKKVYKAIWKVKENGDEGWSSVIKV